MFINLRVLYKHHWVEGLRQHLFQIIDEYTNYPSILHVPNVIIVWQVFSAQHFSHQWYLFLHPCPSVPAWGNQLSIKLVFSPQSYKSSCLVLTQQFGVVTNQPCMIVIILRKVLNQRYS